MGSIFNTNSSSFTQKIKMSAMKIFVAIALVIATVSALPLETAERATQVLAAQPEGEASTALKKIADDIAILDVAALDEVITTVETLEANVPDAVADLATALTSF